MRIPVWTETENSVVVLYRQGRALDISKLRETIVKWIEANAEPALIPPLTTAVSRSLRIEARRRTEVPLPPSDYLSQTCASPYDVAMLRAADHAVVCVCPERIGGLRSGMWATVAAGRALAAALGGVVFDSMSLRILPSTTLSLAVPDSLGIAVARHIMVPASLRDDGSLWVSTSGMTRFGLPDLQVIGAPADSGGQLQWIMNGAAQSLVSRLAHLTQTADHAIDWIELEDIVTIRPEDVSESLGGEWLPPGSPIRMRMTLIGPDGGKGAPMITLNPPDHNESMSVWVSRVCGVLLGEPQSEVRRADANSAVMLSAHAKAHSELAAVRSRYQNGLPVGAFLYMKHGFRTGQSREYMWFVVGWWAAGHIRGTLVNDSTGDPKLTAGQRVEIAEADVFDWMIRHPDGSEEGGYTTAALFAE